jgi:hypothetical protein
MGSIKHFIIQIILNKKNTLLEDVHRVDLFFKLGDVQVTFGILIHCYAQQPLYQLRCTPPSPTFIDSPLFFTPPSFKCLDTFWV